MGDVEDKEGVVVSIPEEVEVGFSVLVLELPAVVLVVDEDEGTVGELEEEDGVEGVDEVRGAVEVLGVTVVLVDGEEKTVVEVEVEEEDEPRVAF